ncbi:MAG TPA: phosphoribosyl-ATP diphosphatase [Micropepsaceae bacterium]|nr:phosphoribosyl-ATP diphosphatase [Micropepsaceae bacterium]
MKTLSPLDDLYAQIVSRKDADPKVSYTAKLLSNGIAKPAKKLGEEAVETVIAAMEGDREHLILESTDLLYHLLVVWAKAGVTPDDVMRELHARRGRSGLDEKASRKS